LLAARLGSARLGSARLGSAPLRSAPLRSARLGSARLGSARLAGRGWLATKKSRLRRYGAIKGPLNCNRALKISQSVTGINKDLSIVTGIKKDLSIVIETFAHSCLAGSSRHSTSRDSEKACLDACTHTCFRGLSLPFCGWNEISLKDI